MKLELLINSIEQTHVLFHQQAVKAVNISLTMRNWMIGFYIVEFEQNGEERAMYGTELLATLASKCSHVKGITERSLRNFRMFSKTYPEFRILLHKYFTAPNIRWSETTESNLIHRDIWINIRQSLTAELQNTENEPYVIRLVECLSYTHFEQLISITDKLRRSFYEMECMKGCWTIRELRRQINSLYFERSGLSQDPKLLSEITLQKTLPMQTTDLIKSVYAFEFLGLNTKAAVEESDLETALLDHLQEFMMELGHGFCLEARQKKLLIGDEYFFVDLVFYHRILKCHVLIELKVEEFNHYNIGQLNTYVSYFKKVIQLPDDNPPVGILLVTNKNEALIEYATAGMDNQLFISKYLLELPSKEKLEAFIKHEIDSWK